MYSIGHGSSTEHLYRDLNNYYCCDTHLSMVDVEVRCFDSEIQVSPIFKCSVCNVYYQNMYDHTYIRQMGFRNNITNTEIQRTVFSSPLCADDLTLYILPIVEDELLKLETKLIEMINKKNADALDDLRCRINTFTLC